MGFFINQSSTGITDEDKEKLDKLDEVGQKMENLDEGLQKIKETTNEVNNLKTEKADINHVHDYEDITNTPNLDNYATKDYVVEEVEKIGTSKGEKGDKGEDGVDGLSAYQIAVNNGFEGNEQQWLSSLKGETGASGINGKDGSNGLSAYEIAKEKGYEGTEEEWLVSLKGSKGDTGDKGADGVDGTFDINTTYSSLVTENKTVLGAINEVFTNVSNGKELLASAITDKGVETSNTDTFATMANNISSITASSGGNVTVNELGFLNAMKNRTSLAYLFYFASELTEITGMIDTSSVNNMSYMFYGCSKLTSISQLDTSNVTNMSNMFYNCSKLTTIPQLDTSSVTNMSSTFGWCTSLTSLKFNPNAKKIISFTISSCTAMTSESLTEMIESLPVITNSVNITFGSTLSSRLTEEAKDLLLEKGYSFS